MDYYQSRTPQQYSSTSATGQSSQASNYGGMYGTNNSMYYSTQQCAAEIGTPVFQPSAQMQHTYGTTPQHYSSGMTSTQQSQHPSATAHSHSSHWNNDYTTDYGSVQQQTTTQTAHQPRRQQQTAYSSTGYNSYRQTASVQQDGVAAAQAAAMGMGRPTHAQVMPQAPPTIPQQDLPLRMVVEAKYVGAIIGQGGSNIREISKDSKARCVVDVQRAMRDHEGTIEKVISILGQPENCSRACVKILEVVQREVEKEDSDKANEVVLKLRAHNQLVGRLIGKQGSNIKKIMQDTNSVIFVSNSEPTAQMGAAIPPMYDVLQMERTITVRAPTIQDVSAAEQRISSRLRMSFETDIANRLQQFPGYPMGVPGMPNIVNPIGDAYAALASGMNMRPNPQSNQAKSVRIFVPNNMVGAIIGTKGANIRNIMRNSGAQIKIEGGDRRKEGMDEAEREREREREREERERNPEEERMVTIIGNDSQQCRAQFWIYQRVAEQTNHHLDEVKLRTEVQVPAKLVGRIIGKGGQNVRELQRITGAQVKIPDESEDGSGEGAHKKEYASPEEMSWVRIIGNYQSSQSVQYRIAHVCAEFTRMNMGDRKDRGYRDMRGDKEGGAGSPSSQ